MPLLPAWADVAKEAPDARAKISRNEKKSVLLGWMEECFCVNCGKSHGMVSKDWAGYIFCLCDHCVATHGRPINAVEIPDTIVNGPRGQNIGG
jgi:hypothetical protein